MTKSLRYEIGPIRPPNEAYSLLLRFTRNCPWNKCLFCHIYKERKFEARKFEEIKRDIDTVKEICEDIRGMSLEKGHGGRITESLVEKIFSSYALDQVWDYALDLKNFHEPSHDLLICPVLIATKAPKAFTAVERTPQNDNLLFL